MDNSIKVTSKISYNLLLLLIQFPGILKYTLYIVRIRREEDEQQATLDFIQISTFYII